MRVLGISPLDKDSTVTVVEDGKITYAASEERLTRVKLQDGFPWQALDDGLRATGLAATDFDVVTYPFLTWEQETQLFQKNLSDEREYLDGGNGASGAAFEAALARAPALGSWVDRDAGAALEANPDEQQRLQQAVEYVKRLHRDLAALRGSWRWRGGGLVTAPLRELAGGG